MNELDNVIFDDDENKWYDVEQGLFLDEDYKTSVEISRELNNKR